MKKGISIILAVAATLGFAVGAQAIPTLQVYLDGATYDAATETWILSNSGTFNLWVMGQWGRGELGIYDVKLAAAVSSGETGAISFAPTTAAADGVVDTSMPVLPALTYTSADGEVPVMGDGSPLPTHDIYGPGTSYFQWALGDFTTRDSNVADLIDAYPDPYPTRINGQINVYAVTVTGYTAVHFDAYDHIAFTSARRDARFVFAPFSHDGGTGNGVPEPGSLLLLGAGLLGLGLLKKKRS